MSISINNGSIALICVVGFVLIVVLLLVFSAVQARRRKQGFGAAVGQLGFTPQPQADADLLTQLQQLYAPARVNRVGNSAVKLMGDEKYYLFDVTYTSPAYSSRNSASMTSEFNNVAVLSPHLHLPAFILLNRMKLPGALAGMADSAIIFGATSAGFSEYREVPPAFQMNYMLFVKDPLAVKDTFTDEALTQIGLLDGLVARGYENLLVINEFSLRSSSKFDEVKLAGQVTLARQICDWLVK